MSALKKDVIMNIFLADEVYEWVDDPQEGPVFIIQYKGDKYLFSPEAKTIFLKDFESGFVDMPKMDFIIRNMILDFDVQQFRMQFYFDGDLREHEIDFGDV